MRNWKLIFVQVKYEHGASENMSQKRPLALRHFLCHEKQPFPSSFGKESLFGSTMSERLERRSRVLHYCGRPGKDIRPGKDVRQGKYTLLQYRHMLTFPNGFKKPRAHCTAFYGTLTQKKHIHENCARPVLAGV